MNSTFDASPIAQCLMIAHRRGVALARLLLAGSVAADNGQNTTQPADHPGKTAAGRATSRPTHKAGTRRKTITNV